MEGRTEKGVKMGNRGKRGREMRERTLGEGRMDFKHKLSLIPR